MSALIQNQQFILQGDATEARPWQVWINGVKLLQSNGTNPRIRQLDLQKQEAIANSLDQVLGLVYEVRIVKLGVTAALIVPSNKWELSFDGTTLVPTRVLAPIRESAQQDLYWLVNLELQRV